MEEYERSGIEAWNLDSSLNEIVKEESDFWRRCEVAVLSRRENFFK